MVLATLLAGAAPRHAHAQSRTDESPVLQDATGGIWATATLDVELALLVALFAAQSGASNDDEPWCTGACASLLVGLVVAAPILAGVVTQISDTPADVPFVAHTAIWGAVAGALTGGGIGRLVSGTPEGAIGGLIAGAVLGAGLVGTYAVARRRMLLDDPDVVVPAHVMMWAPFGVLLTGGLFLLLIQAANPNPERIWTAAMVLGLIAAGLYGGSIALAEALHAGGDDTGATTAPLGAWTTSF